MSWDDNYILDGHTPVLEPDLDKWYKFFSNSRNRRVDWTVFRHGTISTVFLGSDHSLPHTGSPVLFETMAFIEGEVDSECVRTCTWDEAQAAHNEMVARYQSADKLLVSDSGVWNPRLSQMSLIEPLLLTDGREEVDFGTKLL